MHREARGRLEQAQSECVAPPSALSTQKLVVTPCRSIAVRSPHDTSGPCMGDHILGLPSWSGTTLLPDGAVESCVRHLLVLLQADEPLAKFLDYCTYGHMIDNVVLIVTGTLHERDVHVRLFYRAPEQDS